MPTRSWSLRTSSRKLRRGLQIANPMFDTTFRPALPVRECQSRGRTSAVLRVIKPCPRVYRPHNSETKPGGSGCGSQEEPRIAGAVCKTGDSKVGRHKYSKRYPVVLRSFSCLPANQTPKPRPSNEQISRTQAFQKPGSLNPSTLNPLATTRQKPSSSGKNQPDEEQAGGRNNPMSFKPRNLVYYNIW